MQITLILLTFLLLWPMNVTAQTDLYPLIPDQEIAGWSRTEEPQRYQGDELFLMIDGGADIYHEYGFSQALAGEYENEDGQVIRMEIYELATAEAAYGIYSFKTGMEGKALDIGQAAFLEEYYLNFWKGNLLVTIVALDVDAHTIDEVIPFGKFVDQHYHNQGSRPKLAELLLSGPIAFSNPKYVRGSIGAMNSYIFDTADVFQVREGMIGFIEDNQVFVFRYADDNQSTRIFNSGTKRFTTSHRFSDVNIKDDLCSMVDRDQNFVVVRKTGQDIVAVIGHNMKYLESLTEQLEKKLNGI